ncbi:MAG: QueT transporter family protein [Oscillospiraceae bacterium]|jgi:uncharacterized membrane protein|nr:QueT transporter family protein [Oscillospiraceae bacterium]
MTRNIVRKTVFAGVVAALYIALVMLNIGYSFGPVQFRAAEALTLLPFLFPESIPGLFIGCLLSNTFSRYGAPDIIIGSLATLLAAFLTARCGNRWLAALPPVIVNALAIGAMITFLYTPDATWVSLPLNIGSVALGQTAVCFGLGVPLTVILQKANLKYAIYRR